MTHRWYPIIPITKGKYSLLDDRRFFFWRFSGERKQARGERGARDTRRGRRLSGAPRSLRVCRSQATEKFKNESLKVMKIPAQKNSTYIETFQKGISPEKELKHTNDRGSL